MSPYLDELEPGYHFGLHAAAVITQGGALLILGHSGAGKSTLSQLLSSRFPILADDVVTLTLDRSGYWLVQDVVPVGFRTVQGSARKPIHIRVPLRGFLRIFQAPQTELAPLPARQLCRYLVDSLFEIQFQREAPHMDDLATWFKAVACIARNYPGWKFPFTPDQAAIDCITSQFGNSTAHSSLSFPSIMEIPNV